jgi:hypothetical protein
MDCDLKQILLWGSDSRYHDGIQQFRRPYQPVYIILTAIAGNLVKVKISNDNFNRDLTIVIPWLHQQNVKWFGSHNWTSQQLWKATLVLPDAPRCSQIGWMQWDVPPSARNLIYLCSSMLRKMWNRIPKYPAQCIVVLKMLQNQNIRMH